MTYDPNQAHPKIPYKGTYPNLLVTTRPDGSQEIRSIEPGQEASFIIHPDGSYSGVGPDGQHVSVQTGKSHSYNADGVSSTADGHSDSKVSGTSRSTTEGGSHSETGGNQSSAGGGAKISGTNDSQINTSAGGDGFHTTEGNIVTDHTGDVHHNIMGNDISQITGNKIEMISGEYGIHVQKGNFDLTLDNGKIKIEASDEIELRVGDNYININRNGIGIQHKGFINIYATGSENIAIVNYGSGKSGILSINSEVIVSGKSNKIKSARGTLLETSVVPPGGQVIPTR
jgi:hypothetical protein